MHASDRYRHSSVRLTDIGIVAFGGFEVVVVAVDTVCFEVGELLFGSCTVAGDEVESIDFGFNRLGCTCDEINLFVIEPFACCHKTVAECTVGFGLFGLFDDAGDRFVGVALDIGGSLCRCSARYRRDSVHSGCRTCNPPDRYR